MQPFFRTQAFLSSVLHGPSLAAEVAEVAGRAVALEVTVAVVLGLSVPLLLPQARRVLRTKTNAADVAKDMGPLR
jgi:hypothetical protein